MGYRYWSQMFLQDVRYAVRTLWHSKGFAVTAILCLGLGIGLNTTIFSMVDGVLLKPYPYTDPDRILVLGTRNTRSGAVAALSYPDLRDWREASSAFTTITATQGRSLTVSDGTEEPERFLGAAISWDLFSMLGTPPVLGRGFLPDDDRPGAGGVVLISHRVWTTRYNADPGVLGRVIRIDAGPHEIVGVMPEGFAFPFNQRLWIPLAPVAHTDPRAARSLLAFGRVAPGVTSEQARHELEAIAERLAETYPQTNEAWTARLRTLREAFLPEEVPRIIYLMMAGVTLVLFIACSNVANLLLARATSRQRELSVRAALGAGRGRIVRQLLTESVVLALAAVPLGLVLAEVGTRLIASAMPTDQVPYYVTWTVDGRSMAYAVAVATVTALLFGLFPAMQVSRGQLHDGLKEGSRGNSASRSLLRSSLVVAQVSLALVALVGALLFVRSFVNLGDADIGFETAPLMTMRIAMGGEPYAGEDARLRRVADIVQRIENLPGVEAVFASNFVPLSGGGGGGSVVIDGRTLEAGEAGIAFIGVTPGFARTLALPILLGRDFTEAEGLSRTPVAIVNQTFSTRFWPGDDPLGRRFRLASGSLEAEWFTVVGVTRDIRLYGVNPEEDRAPATAFVPYAYQQALNTGLTVRVAGSPPSITSAVRTELNASDPNIPMFQAQTMEEARRRSYWQYGLFGWIFGTTGIVGVLLASIGVYGVLSYSVSQRTQEIGVRVALGASAADVLRLVVGDGLRLAAVGIIVGVALAPVGTWFARSLFYNVGPFDPLTFVLVAAFLLAVALLASYVPARRATKVDPIIALRAE
jgi:putative ABC transport system permease protein